jgi:site-specific recombinase
MFFLFCFALCGLAISLTGILMFAYPAVYVDVVNWYYSKIGRRRRVSIEKYSRWYYRLAGLMLFLQSIVFFYAFWLQVRRYLR